MSRNLYLGTTLDPIVGAQDPNQIPFLVGEAWEAILDSDFEARADAIAEEIQRTRPDVIGLQEVAEYFVNGAPALDFLSLLQAAMEARQLGYEFVTRSTNTNITMPAVTQEQGFFWLRWVDHDVVLVADGVEASGTSGTYSAAVPLPFPGPTQFIVRGWNRVDLTVRGRGYHLVNTHFEDDRPTPLNLIQLAQAGEMLQMLQSVQIPVILVGDLNALSDGSTSGTYPALIGAGFEDAHEISNALGYLPGNTCCFADDLRGGSLFERIDYVMARGGADNGVRVVTYALTGERKSDETTDGLKPSDHAGLFARIGFPRD
jgi:endonuclease/exonuclease/phosphatase family metal-dependent hydrolase